MPNGDENLTNFPDWMANFMQQGNAGNRQAALRAIWDNRPDIQRAYQGNTMFPTPEQAVEDWLKNTTEQIADPVTYASEQGWMPQGQAYGGYQWAQLYLQSAIAAAQQAYQWAVQQGIDEQTAKDNAWREAQMELERQMAVGYVNGQPTIAMQQLQQTGQYQQGLLDLQRQQQEMARQAMMGYANGAPTMDREQMEGSLGLQYLNLLSQQSGPRDWVSYWNTVRGAQNTNLPAWAAALQQRQNLPAWGANYGQQQQTAVQPWQYATPMQPWQYATPMGQREQQTMLGPGNTEAAMQLMQQRQQQYGVYPAENLPGESQAGAEYRTYGYDPNYQTTVQPYQYAIIPGTQPGNLPNTPTMQLPDATVQTQDGYNPQKWAQMGQQLSPWQVSPTQWQNMLPSEMEGLAGMIESGGGYAPDWLAQMQKSWPTGGTVNPTSWWR